MPDEQQYSETKVKQKEEVPANKQESAAVSVNTQGLVILQWLTYAFWGWTLVALYWLTAVGVQYFVQKSASSGYYDTSSSDMLAYPMAAVLVLFTISIICDVIYSRFEPTRKTGVAMVIMVIHAVIFALCSIGSLIVAVFAVVNMLISGSSEGATVTLITAGIMTLLYAVTLLRTLRPAGIVHLRKIYWTGMLIAVLVISSLGIFGPIAYAQRTKNDRLVRSGLSNIASAVNEYAQEKKKLPASLDEPALAQYFSSYSAEDVERIIDAELVTYVPKEQLNTTKSTPANELQRILEGAAVTSKDSKMSRNQDPVFHYQLCAIYDEKSDNRDRYGIRDIPTDGEYPVYPDTDYHEAGKVCYDLQTDYLY